MNLPRVRATKLCHEKKGNRMAFRESISRLLGRTYTPEAAERIKQLNASMDEFVRLLHTNGYDGKNLAKSALAGPSESPSCAQDAQISEREKT
jgi:divalent metal cation (Fe/Co/Zn/Cd) transporter